MNVDTGTFEAITSRVAAMEAELAELAGRAAREAEYQDMLTAAAARPRATGRHARPRHLRVAGSGQDGER